jgi:hypothetical protein
MRFLTKRGKAVVNALAIVGVMLFFISCGNTQQRYSQPAPGTPPSFENDMGHPAAEDEKIVSRGRGLF